MTMKAYKKPWFGSWPKGIPQKLEYPNSTLQELLKTTAEEFPDKIAIVYSSRNITYKELDSLSDKFAGALAVLGVGKGDKIAILLPNIPQFIVAYYGALKAGAVLTPISPLNKEREVTYQLKDSEAETLVVLNSLYPIVEKKWRETLLRNVIITNMEEYASSTSNSFKMPTQKPSIFSFQQLIEEESQPPKVAIDAKTDLATLQYTGGTTGTPKAAMLTHFNMVSNAFAFSAWIKAKTAEETFLTALPLFHIYGMTTSMNVPVRLAARMVLLPRFEPEKVLDAIQLHKVTVFCGVPTMYSMLLATPELSKFDLTSIRVCISGASPLPPEVQKRFMRITGGFLGEGYGLTEASPVTHCNLVDETMGGVRVGSIGLPLPDTDARIVDLETGKNPLGPGEVGELAVKGPQIMKGYWGKPEETKLVLRNNWLLTGDIARMDQDGYFYITDRKKDLIKYKDYSVYPREIEDVIYEHPAVKLCAVIGKPNPVVGEVPKAFVVLKDGANATAAELIQFIKEKVALYKAVHEVEFRKELPISPAGKVLRRILQKEEMSKLKCS